jgi:hypothetical protein
MFDKLLHHQWVMSSEINTLLDLGVAESVADIIIAKWGLAKKNNLYAPLF